MSALRRYLADQRGAVTVEFVAVVPSFLIVVFLVIEVTPAFFWWHMAEKATQRGARLAVVHDAAAAGFPARNALREGALFGTPCRHAGDRCIDFGAQVCAAGGDGCNAAFDAIVGRMREGFGEIEDGHVTIAYEYVGLGYAGGPAVASVTVTLSGVAFQTGFLALIGNVLGAAGASIATLADIGATLTGEDLSAAGVGV